MQILDLPINVCAFARPPESDAGMPMSERDFKRLSTEFSNLSQEVRELSNSVSAIQTRLGMWGKIFGFVASAALAVSLVALGWCYHIGIKVAVIESGGNTKLVTQLEAPKSSQQLQAALATVTAQVQTARADGKAPDEKKVKTLASAVAQVVQHKPDLPEAWQTAAALVSYRAVASKPIEPKECTTQLKILQAAITRDSQKITYYGEAYEDCTVILDGASISEVFRNVPNSMHIPPGAPSILKFTHVHVIYRGGTIPPANLLIFLSCTFEFQLNTQPQPSGQELTQTLLTANNINEVSDFQTTVAKTS